MEEFARNNIIYSYSQEAGRKLAYDDGVFCRKSWEIEISCIIIPLKSTELSFQLSMEAFPAKVIPAPKGGTNQTQGCLLSLQALNMKEIMVFTCLV